MEFFFFILWAHRPTQRRKCCGDKEFDWNLVDSVLMSLNVLLLYQRYTLLLVAARKNALEDVSPASLAFHARNFSSAAEKNVLLFTRPSITYFEEKNGSTNF